MCSICVPILRCMLTIGPLINCEGKLVCAGHQLLCRFAALADKPRHGSMY
jgi:hypothetical protein